MFKYLSLIALDCFHKFRFNCLVLMEKRTFQHRVQLNCLQLIIHCISKIPTNYKQLIFQPIATTISCANVLIWISIENVSIHWETNTQELIWKLIHFKLLPTKMLEFPMENAWIWFPLQIKNLAQFENVRVKWKNIQVQLKTVTTEWLILNILVGVWLRQNISSADE